MNCFVIFQVTPWCIHHSHGPTWWQSLPCTRTLSTTRISQHSLLCGRTSSGKRRYLQETEIHPLINTYISYVLVFNTVCFLQPPFGQSGHLCPSQLLSVLAPQPTPGQQQGRIQRQLRLETGRCLYEPCRDSTLVYTGDINIHSLILNAMWNKKQIEVAHVFSKFPNKATKTVKTKDAYEEIYASSLSVSSKTPPPKIVLKTKFSHTQKLKYAFPLWPKGVMFWNIRTAIP